MSKIRVLVVDDHTIVRDGICALLALAGDIEVVGEAANGKEALDMVRTLAPDIVLMDIAMPVMSGLEATKQLRKDFPAARIIALTQFDDKEYVFPLIEAGASGFLSKVAASSELTAAIRNVFKGDAFLSPTVAKVMMDDYRQAAATRDRSDSYEQLTPREKDVLKLVAEGYTTQEMADMLVLSPKTVEGHKTSLMSKLDVHSRIDLVKYALRKRIIDV
ncbi:MAG: response regulator transcription factor [Dehalococcoidia bacterium]|nr:response regulator transcription factor [Dehalococcoidia bacterium]